MAVKLFDTTLTNATMAGLTNSHYYWVDRTGNVVDAGTALIATAAVPVPTDQAIFDVSPYQAVELFASHAALTSAVGGKISAAQLMPDLVQFPSAPIVVGGSTVDTTLAATAESLSTLIVNPAVLGRAIKLAIAVLWTTVTTAGSGMRITVWGHQDGLQIRR